MKRCFLSSLVFSAFTPFAWGQDTPTQFENDGLWEWFLAPTSVAIKGRPASKDSAEERTQLVALCEVGDAELSPQLLNIADSLPLLVCGSGGDSRVRLVAFDQNRERLESGGALSCSFPGASIHMKRVRLGDKTLKYLGVEHLTPERQKRHAAEAQEKLLKEGIELPYPTEGEAFPYRFGLPEGPAIESKQLLGKVVLIQWWASW